jgi:hypothetical protein
VALDGILFSAGTFSSLAARDGVVHISYHHHTNGNLKYFEGTP